MKTALVTGDAGFVGRHMVAALIERGYSVTGVDIEHTDVDLDIRKGPYVHITMDCRKFFNRYADQYDLVVHLAAVVGGRRLIEKHPLTLAVDLEIDAAFFRWAAQTRQPRIVYYSSSAAYPTSVQNGNPRLHSVESMIDVGKKGMRYIGVPDMSYGWAKMTGEYLATLAEERGVRCHVFRPFSGYGETQDLNYPFPSFIKRAVERQDPFEIWGDGTQVRDWIHIDDVVEGTLQCVEQDVVGPTNLCTGRPITFIQLKKLVCDAAGYQPAMKLLGSEPAGVMYRVGDVGKMYQHYIPKISLEEGIERALKSGRQW